MADNKPLNNASIVDAAWDSAMNGPAEVPSMIPSSEPAPRNNPLDEDFSQSSSSEATSGSEDSSSVDSLETPAPAKQEADTSEFIYVTGPNGREKLKIDYSNKEAIKKAFAAQYGMRKFQAERDASRAEVGKFKDKASNYDKIEKLWSEGGLEGLISALDKDGFEKLVQARVDRAQKRLNATEEEQRMMDLEEREAARELENKRLREQVEKQLAESKQREEAADLKRLESKLHPQFHKYNFSGKLGDAKVEHRYNQFLWAQAMDGLAKYPEDQELTPAMIEREFREVALDLKRVIAKQSEDVAAKAIAAKKVAARENAGVQVVKNTSQPSLNNSVREDLKKGNVGGAIDSLFKAFGR